ncbi:hypothetical protein [Pseudoruegeria sp. SHC-113]|uniref:COG3904 family protein n=1 Tax=Pseudoruegeria sp. SHC-113 TaxID=2855439 RepID=UPI0021BB3876|nr:hypothetical protein [Pseudoruegeria sp. SHC-113]MCT8162165.1 hypothetical protein [Pseudoruegeria sp. SHC-113]
MALDVARGLRLILVAQLAMAGVLVAADGLGALSGLFTPSAPLPTGPVSPGDQTREYRPDRTLPTLRRPDAPPGLELPQTFSDRLEFEEREIEGLGNVLLLSGTIGEGDAARFAAHLAERATPPARIALHSPGGIVMEALEIGRRIRADGLDTVVPSGAYCLSSCPYILAAGPDRAVGQGGVVGVHQHYYEQPKFLPVVMAVEGIQFGQGETLEYLLEMGIAPALMVFSLKTPPEQIYALVEEELLDTRLATEILP